MIYLYQTSSKFLAAFLSIFIRIEVIDTTSSVTKISNQVVGTSNIIKGVAPLQYYSTENQTARFVTGVVNLKGLEYRTAGIHGLKALLRL